MKLIHLTDTHFVPQGKTLYGGDPRAVLEAAIADINRQHADADLAVITGDLTHWGEEEAFTSLAEVLSGLEIPLKLLIGNHDNRALFQRAFPNQILDENGFVQSVQKTEQGHLLFLDTNLVGTHAGWYCEKRRAWLSQQLDACDAAGQPAFLFMHHPPFKIGLTPLDRISLQEADKFYEVLKPYKERIRHIFFGHIHRPLSGSWNGIPFSTLRAMNHQCWLDFCQQDEIAGSFEQPAYAIAFIEEQSVIIHTHDFMDQSPKFNLRDSPVKDWAIRNSHP